MKRLAAGATTLALGGLLVAGAAARAVANDAPGSVGPSRAQLTQFVCHRALDPANRSISVTAVMRPLTRTMHMALKFNLLMTSPASGTTVSVRFGDLGTWKSPKNPTLGQLPGDVWNLQKSVVQLAAPDTYRFRVTFRWTGTGGRVIASATKYSSRCRQPELRPDLQVGSIAVAAIPGRPASDRYTAVITNAGNSAAGPFEVLFAPADGATPKTKTVQLLRAHSSDLVSFVGPLCTSATAPTITADSSDEVDDLNRGNNALTATCPAAAPS